MPIGTVITIDGIQLVRLPLDARFSENVKRVEVRVVGRERVIAPADAAWDSFFGATPTATDDFMSERSSHDQVERESL